MIEIRHQQTGEVLLAVPLTTLAGYKFKGRLNGADLANMMLPGVDFTLGNLSNVDFRESMLEDAVFLNSVLTNIQFEKAELANAVFFRSGDYWWAVPPVQFTQCSI